MRLIPAWIRIAAAVLCLLVTAAPAEVYADSSARLESRLHTGGVSAELEIDTKEKTNGELPAENHYEEKKNLTTGSRSGGTEAEESNDAGNENSDEKNTRLQPGSKAPYCVTVVNQQARAWVRVHFEVIGSEAAEKLAPLSFAGLSDAVVVKGDYLYCTRPLEKGERLQLCEGFFVPDFSSLPEALNFRVRAIPEAMQDLGRSPDFSKDSPWEQMGAEQGDTAFLKRSADGGLRLIVDRKEMQVSGQLFSDLTELLPGETVTERVTVEQKGAGFVGLRLKLQEHLPEDSRPAAGGAQTASASEAEQAEMMQKLLQLLQLEIFRDGKLLYQNHFLDASLKNGISLGYFLRGEHQLEFRIRVPEELENAFMQKAAGLSWTFEAKSEGTSGGSSGGGTGGGTKPSVSGEQMYDDPDGTLRTGLTGGSWQLLEAATHQWSYTTANGMRAKNGWLYIHNPYADNGKGENAWFKFNADGIMEYGWIRSANQNWYYCHAVSDGRLGTMQTGWHQDADDGRYYYLDPLNGIMQTGWRTIEGKTYYFAGTADIPEQTWYYEAFDRALGDTAFGKWVYKRLGLRSYGSLYQKERTPDGSYVDEQGVLQEEGGT